MEEIYRDYGIIVWAVAIAAEVSMGLLAQAIAEKKGHSGRWFWAGLLLSLVGVVWAAGLPDETLRRQVLEMRERCADAGMEPVPAPIANEGPDDGEVVAVLAAATAACGERRGRRYVLRPFRPAGEGSTVWSRAARGSARAV